MRFRSGGVLALLALVLLPFSPAQAAAPPAPTLRALNYSPSSRTLTPTAVQSTLGTVTGAQNVLAGGSTRLSGNGSGVVLDFGKEVGGIVTLSFAGTSDAGQKVGLAFTESSAYIGTMSDASNGGSGADGALTGNAVANGTYTMPNASLRGGFRYLTVFLQTGGWVDLKGVSLRFTLAPDMADPSAYPNYFYSNDDLLNRIWYAGAYTVQTNTIDPHQGRVWGPPSLGWDNSATVGTGTSVLADGAKRDRTVWPGDLGISVPTAYVSTNDMKSVKNALQTLYDVQKTTGELPFAGPQVNFYGSDTYHLSSLLGTELYYQYSNDRAWLDTIWPKFTLGMKFITDKIDGQKLLNVTGTSDWARSGQGGENIEANALMYGALTGAADLADLKGDATLSSDYTAKAVALKSAANRLLWDAKVGMYQDNPTSTLKPQDGNALAVLYGLTDSPQKATAIGGNLGDRWNSFGAVTPEKGGNIATFPGSMEVLAHFAAGDDQRGLDLIRREWGYMLNSPLGTKSTFWEGYKADGTFDYGGAYMSLSHGWATGPTSALTFDVLGLRPQTKSGTYRFVPHPGDLKNVQGRITLPAGALDASWTRDVATGTFTEELTSPGQTTGVIGVPKLGGGDIQVAINGTTVWKQGQFTAAAGITGASQDDAYVYLTGVPAGSWKITATGVGVPTELPSGYTLCAAENGTCTVSGTRTVAYGAGTFVSKSVSGSTPCTSAAFGSDPAKNLQKSCYLAPAGKPAGWRNCGSEGATCAVTQPQRIAYGANGAFAYTLATSSLNCSNATFGGDPAPGVAKQCYAAPAGGPGDGWTSCATEGSTCAATPGQPVAYGANGVFAYTTASSQTACGSSTFGDPIANVVKACYLRSGAPSGFAKQCAAENSTCAIGTARTVAYGAAGRYVYRFATSDTACTSATFGQDPLFGAAKSCWVTS